MHLRPESKGPRKPSNSCVRLHWTSLLSHLSSCTIFCIQHNVDAVTRAPYCLKMHPLLLELRDLSVLYDWEGMLHSPGECVSSELSQPLTLKCRPDVQSSSWPQSHLGRGRKTLLLQFPVDLVRVFSLSRVDLALPRKNWMQTDVYRRRSDRRINTAHNALLAKSRGWLKVCKHHKRVSRQRVREKGWKVGEKEHHGPARGRQCNKNLQSEAISTVSLCLNIPVFVLFPCRNWCPHTVTKTVTCQVQNGTILQRVYQACRWPQGCSGGRWADNADKLDWPAKPAFNTMPAFKLEPHFFENATQVVLFFFKCCLLWFKWTPNRFFFFWFHISKLPPNLAT